jgi:hypothetical protein
VCRARPGVREAGDALAVVAIALAGAPLAIVLNSVSRCGRQIGWQLLRARGSYRPQHVGAGAIDETPDDPAPGTRTACWQQDPVYDLDLAIGRHRSTRSTACSISCAGRARPPDLSRA